MHRILQARILDWVTISFSKGSSQPSNWTHVSCVSCIGRQVLYHWATWDWANHHGWKPPVYRGKQKQKEKKQRRSRSRAKETLETILFDPNWWNSVDEEPEVPKVESIFRGLWLMAEPRLELGGLCSPSLAAPVSNPEVEGKERKICYCFILQNSQMLGKGTFWLTTSSQEGGTGGWR